MDEHTKEVRMSKLSWFALGVVAGLTAAAVGQEMQKPPEQRSWKGTIAGVPYNFRLEEWGDIAGEYWNPNSDAILSPHAIGIGWGINFAAVAQRAKGFVESPQGERTLTEPARR
jgi:hypothetical protein